MKGKKQQADSVAAAEGRLILDGIPQGLLVLDTSLRVHSTNARFRVMFQAEEEVVGRPLDQVVQAFELRERGLEVLATGVAQRGISFEPTGPGPRACRCDLTRVDRPGQESLLLLVIDNVNELERRRLAEQERKSAESADRDFLNMLQSLDAILWEAEIPPETRARPGAVPWVYTFVSPRASDILGYPVSDWYTQSDFWVDRLHPADRKRVIGLYRDAIETRRPCEAEYRILNRDGGVVWVADRAHPLLDVLGRPCGLRGLLFEITQRKQAEEAFERSEANYREFVERASVGICRSSHSGRLLSVNPALATMLGYAPGELRTLSLADDVYQAPADRDRIIEQCRHVGSIQGVEVAWRRKDRSPIRVRLSGRAVHESDGEIAGFEMIVEDVTQRARLEQRLRESQKLEAVGQLAGGIAHDFNNLVMVIQGYSGLVRKQAGEARVCESVEQIEKATEKAASLIRQLLAFSRKQKLEPRIVDLNAIVADSVKILERLAGRKVRLVAALAPGLGPVRADPTQIEQVLMNLVVNARDAMPDGGRLTIETRNLLLAEDAAETDLPPGPYVCLAVADTGIGMDAETRSHIFDPFYTTKPLNRGTGLGLSTVHGIVKQSGAFIDVETALGVGTRFEIRFPRHEKQRAGSSLETATILVAEDEAEVLQLVSRTLASAGYRVLRAADGAEALRLFRTHADPIDLLLADVVMPPPEGPQLAREVARLRPGTAVLFMSGFVGTAHLRALPADAPLLPKPFRPAELLRRVSDLLGGKGRA